jgi:hypothetical protein
MRPPSRDWLIRNGARFGYAARGGVYLLVGAFALAAAVKLRHAPEGVAGAIAAMARSPLGHLGVWLLTAGLAVFAAWRFVQAVFDADGAGTSRRGIVHRLGKAFSGCAHAALAWVAARAPWGLVKPEEVQARDGAAAVLALPLGEVLLAGAAGAILVIAAGNGLKAWRHDFGWDLDCTAGFCRWARGVARVGYAARGAVFAVIAVLLFLAALHRRADEARGLGGSLQALGSAPLGSWLVAGCGAGFVAFGLFGLIQARFRRMPAPRGLTK